jgi:hypothetical protein
MLIWGGVITWGSGRVFADRTFDDGAAYDPATDTWRPIAAGFLEPRIYHSAVWTGTEMIIWGRRASGGARYNPVADAWSPLSPHDEPTVRQMHSAVWTGTEMIIWSGAGPGLLAVQPGGARYNPATDVWTPLSRDGEPAPRERHATVWTGQEMVVWGGETEDPAPDRPLVGTIRRGLNDGAAYDPERDAWRQIAPAALNPSIGHTAVWTGTEMIVFGGIPGAFARYDPASDRWAAMALPTEPVPNVRSMFGHTAVWTGSEMIVYGDGDGLWPGARYNPASDAWSLLPSSDDPAARCHRSGSPGSPFPIASPIGRFPEWSFQSRTNAQ